MLILAFIVHRLSPSTRRSDTSTGKFRNPRRSQSELALPFCMFGSQFSHGLHRLVRRLWFRGDLIALIVIPPCAFDIHCGIAPIRDWEFFIRNAL